jgi:molybdopterin/thiamine biosynthesis adenylyltransferase
MNIKYKQSLTKLFIENQEKKLENEKMLPKALQLKIAKSKILLINLTSSITELAKLLILKDFNVYLYDKEKVTENDVNNNIYIKEEDLGKKRIDIIYEHLIPLSNTVSIVKIDDYMNIKDIKFVVYGFTDYYKLIELEDYFTRKNIFFYSINTSGLYGFYYNNLDLKISHNKKEIIISPVFLRKSEKFFKNNKNCYNEKDHLKTCIFLLELYYRKNVNKKDLKKQTEEENSPDNYKKTENYFMKKTIFIENYLRKMGFNSMVDNKELKDYLRKFLINFNQEFNPICSMLANIVSNEIYNFVIDKELPKINITCYNSEIQKFDYNSFLN